MHYSEVLKTLMNTSRPSTNSVYQLAPPSFPNYKYRNKTTKFAMFASGIAVTLRE